MLRFLFVIRYCEIIEMHGHRDARPCASTDVLLFLSNKNVDRGTRQFPFFPQFVFEESFVWFLDVLRQVGIKDEGWNLSVGQLTHIFYFDIFTFD